MYERYAELTRAQRAFIENLSDEQIVQLTEAAQLFRDMPTETKEFLRSEFNRPALDFLRGAEPETLRWLQRADRNKIGSIDNAIQFLNNAEFMGKWTWRAITGFLLLTGGFFAAFKWWKGG